MDDYMSTGFNESQVRFAHELGNLADKNVVTKVERNNERNPNSIMTILSRVDEEIPDARSVRIVSPYLFLAEYKNEDGEIVVRAGTAIAVHEEGDLFVREAPSAG